MIPLRLRSFRAVIRLDVPQRHGYANCMSTARQRQPWSVDEYLAAELVSTVKHEYLGGYVYAMAGACNAHNLIATNITVTVGSRLRGSGCRVYNSDTKIRVRLPTYVRFYYPDASVVCHPNPPADSFQDEPSLIAEVLSTKTRRTDEGEKQDAYLTIPSLSAYLLVEQTMPLVIVLRRTDQGFVREEYPGLAAVVPLDEIGAELPLAEIYDGVEFVPENDRDDG